MSCDQSSISPCSPASADLNSGSIKPARILEVTGARQQTQRLYLTQGLSPCLVATIRPPSVLVTARSTATHSKSTKGTSQTIRASVTSPASTRKPCRISTSCVAAFLASLSQTQDIVQASKTREVRCFLKSLGSSRANSHAICCLRTSKAFCLTTTGVRRSAVSKPLMTWGMTVNGKCLTARISAYHKTANASSLSDILEPAPDPKCFLSSDQCRAVLRRTVKLNWDNQPTAAIAA